MAKTRRIAFTFDERSLVALDQLPKDRLRAILVADPDTGARRTVWIPQILPLCEVPHGEPS